MDRVLQRGSRGGGEGGSGRRIGVGQNVNGKFEYVPGG